MTADQTALGRARWAVAAMFLANGFLFGSWAPQIPLLLPRHDITESTLGFLIFVLGVGALAAMSVSGVIIARAGSVRALQGFALLAVGTLPLVVHAPGLWTLGAAMAAMGAFLGSMDVAMNANAVEVEKGLGRAIMSSSHGFWSLGGFFGGGVGALVLERIGAEAHALLSALIALVLTLGAAPLLQGESAAPAPPKGVARAAVWPRGWPIYILGGMAFFSMVPEGGVLDWGALYLTRELGVSVSTASLGFAVFAGTMAIVRFLGDSVRNRFGAVTTLRVSSLIGTIGILGAGLAPEAWVAILAFGFAGLGIANMMPIILSAAGNQGETSGGGIATATMMGYSGILVAPSAIGIAAEEVGYRAIYIALAGFLLIVAALAGRVGAADHIGAARSERAVTQSP